MRGVTIYEKAGGERRHRAGTTAIESGGKIYPPGGGQLIVLTSGAGIIQGCLGAEECGTIGMRVEQTEINEDNADGSDPAPSAEFRTLH
jgi:hypothetical protein